jgi:hypothetical protein
MKILAALPLLAMMYTPPQDYPVRWHMVHVHYGGRNNSTHGEGESNVAEDGQPTRGFEFTFDNCLPFKENFPHELPGRWVGNDHYELILLRADLNSTKEECILKGRLKDFKYVRVNGKLAAQSLPAPPPAPPPAP